uniref:Uncharacterized protein n=1 Tax=Rhizophora mucronata TaxID=61149 RepID=A0A2P2NCI5_RHIMU
MQWLGCLEVLNMYMVVLYHFALADVE